MLPVNTGLIAEGEIAFKYTDGKMDDKGDSKKETGKEFISASIVLHSTSSLAADFVFTNPQKVIYVFHTVETPPPDRA